jgi:hypothetical protein
MGPGCTSPGTDYSTRMPKRLLAPLLIASSLFLLPSCKKEESRWDKAAASAAPTKPKDPAQQEKAGSSFNKAFPPDGVDGHKRVFTQEKEGFAEAKLQKDGKDVATLAISDASTDADAKAKFEKSTEKVSGYPLVTVGKNQSALLVKDRYQVKVSSQTLDADARKALLQKFDLQALAALLHVAGGHLSMSDDIHQLLQELPQTSLTTRVLGALDYLVPGEWQNITSFEAMIKLVTGEEDQEIIQKVGERAIALYKDETQGYQRAVQVFRLVDNAQGVAGFAALANKVSFLEGITPKSDTTQAIDAGVKLVAELTTFCLVNGLPGDSVGDFASSLLAAGKEDKMRLVAWVALDGLVPLGPDFLTKILDGIRGLTSSQLGEHGRFARIAQYLPGGLDEKKQLLETTLASSEASVKQLVDSNGMTQDSLLEKVRHVIEVSDNRLDYVAAALDMATNYFEHTGIQSVSRRIISRAYGEL